MADGRAPAEAAEAEQLTQRPSVPQVARGSALAALYMVVVRALSGYMLEWAGEAEGEERDQAGRVSALMVGIVFVFHYFRGPQVLGVALSLLQVLLLVAFYLLFSTFIWGPNDSQALWAIAAGEAVAAPVAAAAAV